MNAFGSALRRSPNRSFTTTSILKAKPRKRIPKFSFPTKEAFRANVSVDRHEKPHLYEGQKQRRKWDYPLGEDQRASWKHWRWFDSYMGKWVNLTPNPPLKEFDPYIKEKRSLIHEQDSVQMKFALLLDKDRKKKYFVPPLNMEFDTNLSYFYQHLTKTKFVHGVPYSVESIPIEDSKIYEFEEYLNSMLQMEHFYNKNTVREKSRKAGADRVIANLVNFLMASNPTHPDFQECLLDRMPENAMFWQRGIGFHKYNMPEKPFTFQSHDVPLCQVRTRNKLTEFTPWMEEFMLTGDIPYINILPYQYGIKRMHYRNMVSPGFRHKGGDVVLNYHEAMESGKLSELPPPIHDPCPYGHTQFISLPESFSTQWYKSNLEHCDITNQMEEHIKGHGIMSGWTWSAAQALYQGHWMDDDVTSPYCVQSVISDGSHFAFFCYQLNTLAIDPENEKLGSTHRRNICFGTPFMKLYDIVDGTDDIRLYRNTVMLLMKFVQNNSQNITNSDDATAHNNKLKVQHWDTEKPHIELQEPLHVQEKNAALEVAAKEEMEKNKTWMNRVVDWIKT